MPNSLPNRFYELAKSDLRAANILTQNSLYPQAIYFYAQAFEKAAKSFISYKNYSETQASKKLKDAHGHKLLSLTSTIATIFVDSGIESYMKRGGKESDEEIQKAKNASSLPYLETLKPDKTELISNYENSVKACYVLYTKLREGSYFDSEGLKILRELFKIPKAKYIKFNILARILFPILDGMDLYARYPMDDTRNLNIAFLSRPEIRGACLSLEIMVGDLCICCRLTDLSCIVFYFHTAFNESIVVYLSTHLVKLWAKWIVFSIIKSVTFTFLKKNE